MDLKLKGKVAIVTGGAKGIGGKIVEDFAQEGANVVIADVDLDAAQKLAAKLSKNGTKVIAVKVDVRQNSDAENLAATTMKEFGKIDILVNNAGVGPKILPLLKIDDEEWDRVNDINIKGLHKVTRAVAPHMVDAKYGKIVNFSSILGKVGLPDFGGHYNASKFAVTGYTQTLAFELAEYNINVNAVCPGIVRTPLWEGLLDDLISKSPKKVSREEMFKMRCAGIPLGRPQEPEDMASMVLFLSSDISKNITGESINVNGGMRID
ncbi:MAG: SDR family oxidoreductase [Dehalococcoidales bacterium]|nr:SDR family oxidoreductase [Dehalococcoidales bacterium]